VGARRRHPILRQRRGKKLGGVSLYGGPAFKELLGGDDPGKRQGKQGAEAQIAHALVVRGGKRGLSGKTRKSFRLRAGEGRDSKEGRKRSKKSTKGSPKGSEAPSWKDRNRQEKALGLTIITCDDSLNISTSRNYRTSEEGQKDAASRDLTQNS